MSDLASCSSHIVIYIIFFFFLRLPPLVFLGFPCASAGIESAYNAGDLGSIPGSGRSPGEGNGDPPHSKFLPGEFHGQRSLADYTPWGCKELDTTEQLTYYITLCN